MNVAVSFSINLLSFLEHMSLSDAKCAVIIDFLPLPSFLFIP